MVAGRSRVEQLMLITTVLTGLVVVQPAASASDPNGETQTETPAAQGPPTANGHQRWPRVQISHPVARRAVTEALNTAAERLASPTCSQILTDFAAFTPNLTGTLVSLGTSIQEYVAMVLFIDDSRHRRCLGGALAFTTPGGRVVRVCVDELMRRPELRGDDIVAVIIHEILHTLGLPENPPSSMEITRRVQVRCGKQRRGVPSITGDVG